MNIKAFLVLAGLIVFCSWATPPKSKIKKANWLIGTWENKTKRGSIYESWTKTNDKEFFGKSYRLKDQDTIVFETIRLIQEGDSLFYIPSVKDQNDGLPVRFAMKTISRKAFVFENLKHDFPQVISYTKINTDSLVAEISGMKDGKERKQKFPMKRVK